MIQNPHSRRTFIKTTALALPLGAAGLARAQTNAPVPRANAGNFVSVNKGRFELRGRPYYYIGTNMWYGCYLGDPKLEGGRERLVRELDRLKSIGVTNIRLLAGSETSKLAGAMPRGITRAPHDWDEDLLQGLDFCLAEMGKRDMRGILFFSNYWQWSGGFSQYVNWITKEPIPDPDLPTQAKGDWGGFMRFSARLYTTPAANELYRGYVSHVIQRRNTITNRLYRDDPAVMTWELANEPRPGTDDANDNTVDVYTKWVDETARFIHAQDPNHLVCTGSEGIWGCLKKPEVFVKVHETPAIDYVTVHMWLKNWGWLSDPQISPEYLRAAARARDHVEEHTVLATDTLHKPLVLEEFGLPRDHEKYPPETPATAREDYYKRMFEQVADSCEAGRALQGANFWTWAGTGRVGDKLGTAATFLGDPFCEPQGLNSVFDTDQGTLDVIKQANQQLGELAKG